MTSARPPSSADRLATLGLVAASLLGAPSALAQGRACELVQKPSPPTLQVLQCPGGLVATGEAPAAFEAGSNGAVDQGAVLFEVPSQGPRRSFRVRTPHAVAAVRGTVFAVDVQPTRTSVLVVEGAVAVGRRAGGPAPVLRAGQGIDVEPGDGPLEVKTWGQARAAALLARLGR